MDTGRFRRAGINSNKVLHSIKSLEVPKAISFPFRQVLQCSTALATLPSEPGNMLNTFKTDLAATKQQLQQAIGTSEKLS